MSDLYLTAEQRDFSAPRHMPLLTYQVRSYNKHQVGGPVQASVSAVGPDTEIWELLNMLRTPIHIRNDTGTSVWWGYIAEVKIVVGVLTVTVSLDLMRNRIAVNYSSADGAIAGTTEFVEDADSVAAFGVRELLDNLPNSDLNQALNFRDTLLELKKKAIPAWQVSGSARPSSAEVLLRGWWGTLDWVYYSAAAVQQEVNGTVHTDMAFGMYIGSSLISYNFNYRRFFMHDTQTANEAAGIHLMPIGTLFYIEQTGGSNTLNNKMFSADGAYSPHSETTRDDISFVSGSKTISCAGAGPFNPLRIGDHIRVIGSSSNDGYFTIVAKGSDSSFTVSETVVTEAAGASVTIRRGTSFRASPASSNPTTEFPNPAITTWLKQPSNLAQGFELTALSTLDVSAVQIKMKRSDPISTTQQYVHLNIFSDLGGNPDAVIPNGSSTKALQDLPSAGHDWVTFEFTPTFNIVSGTPYWLYLYRTMDASASKSNQVIVGVDDTGPVSEGVLKRNQDFGVAEDWVEVGGDALFTLAGAVQTTELLEEVLTSSGQFFTAVVIEDNSNVTARLGRSGTQTALQEAENLINIGTSNSKPLLVSLDENRAIRVYEEPAPTDVYYLDVQGNLYNSAMAVVELSECPVAFWVRLKDVIPIEVDVSTLSDPSLVFVEEAEYSVPDERLTIRPRGALSPWSVTKLQKG